MADQNLNYTFSGEAKTDIDMATVYIKKIINLPNLPDPELTIRVLLGIGLYVLQKDALGNGRFIYQTGPFTDVISVKDFIIQEQKSIIERKYRK